MDQPGRSSPGPALPGPSHHASTAGNRDTTPGTAGTPCHTRRPTHHVGRHVTHIRIYAYPT
eukprot:3944781-Heterocapsa_arctica.AAC.1